MTEPRAANWIVPPGYTYLTADRAHLLVRTADVPFVRSLLQKSGTLYHWAGNQPGARPIRGRGTLYVVHWPPAESADGCAVVRSLQHGGLLAPITGRRFLRGRVPRPFNEVLVATALEEADIPTPQVLGACVYARGPFYTGDIARRWLPQARDLADLLFGDARGPRPAELLSAAGDLVGRLHGLGLLHPDLNLRNLLVEQGGDLRIYIIDLEKAQLVKRLSNTQRQAMLERLRRSARRFAEATRRVIEPAAWTAFEEAYARHVH